MNKTIVTSTSFQLLLKDNCYELDDEDLIVISQALQFANNILDMDNLDAIYRLNVIIGALEEAIDKG